MSRTPVQPGPDHPITVDKAPERIVVRAGDHVLADSRNALALREANYPAMYYLPMADVDQSVLKPSDTESYCPYKGEASYYSVVSSGEEIADAIWTYENPYPAVQEIAGHVAFYPSRVEITVSPAD